MNIAEDDDNKVSHKDHSSKKNQPGDVPPPTQGHESEEDAEQADGASSGDEAFEYVVAEEPRDQWDCESITSTCPLHRMGPLSLLTNSCLPLSYLHEYREPSYAHR